MIKNKLIEKIVVGDKLPWFHSDEKIINGEVRAIQHRPKEKNSYKITIFDPIERKERELYYSSGNQLLVSS